MRGSRTQIWQILGGGVAVAAIVVAAPSAARADLDDVDVVVYAGVGSGGAAMGDDTGTPAPEPTCSGCERRSLEVPPARRDEDDRIGVFAIGLAGTEGRVRGGVEVISTLRFDDRAAGHTALVTSAGLDRGRAFAMAGLGVGAYWGDARALGRLAGNAHAALGIRLSRRVVLLGRADVLINDELALPLFSVGLQWAPATIDGWVARPDPDFECEVLAAPAGRRSPLADQPALRY
jgi:hypothetical protein